MNKVAPAQFAIDGNVEQREVTEIARKFQARSDRPNLFR